ncbi:MAG: T9SS type A sorting domain-containing protein [Bacteroidetes bacterium]|nr:T9SS type A sorting domain-containing protein [Bacteroidota bacterium]
MIKLKNKKQSLELQIAAYSVIAAGIMAHPQNAKAQILYTDVHEDVVKGDTANFIFNINEDAYHDLMIFSGLHTNGKFINIQLADSVEVLGNTSGNYLYPFALDSGVLIDENDSNWHDRDYGTMNWQSAFNYGNWIGVEDKYLGVKLILSGQSYYGWIRLDVSTAADQFVVKDFAFEFSAGKGITTADAEKTYGITELMGYDKADDNKPSDMQISFKKAADETKIKEYRLILVNALDPQQLSPTMAMNLPATNFVKIDKTGNDISLDLPESTRDHKGDSIKIGVYYQPYVLSVPDSIHVTEPILSTNLRYVILHIPAAEAGKPTVEDISDHHNGSDIQVQFAKGADENKVDHYRIYVVKKAKADSFNLEVAQYCGPEKFTKVDKTGNDLVKILDASIQDTDGDLIKENTEYQVFVISLAEGINATLHVISKPSDIFTLTSKVSIPENLSNGFNPYNLNNTLILAGDFSIPEGSQLQVFSMDGRLQLSQYLNKYKSSLDHQLSSGVYMLLLITPDHYYYKKVLIAD